MSEDILKALRAVLHIWDSNPDLIIRAYEKIPIEKRLELAVRAQRALEQVRNYRPTN